MRVLFLVPWPAEAASTRLRVEQYLPFLRQRGVEAVVRPFMSPGLYHMVYRPGRLPAKTAHVLASTVARLADVAAAARADVVFVHREAVPFGTTLLERLVARLGTPVVLDFDDAIYLPTNSAPNGFMRYLKRPAKVERLVRLSRAVVVGNRHLQRYALPFNPHTVVVPTPVDTRVYTPRPPRAPGQDDEVVLGWIGSGTTSRYMAMLEAPLARVLARRPNARVEAVGGWTAALDRLPRVRERTWSLAGERDLLHGFDVGLMPYPDNEWARGKCAFKALLYMSAAIPAVCSAVGMVEEVIDSGSTGFLARSEDDWFEMLDALVADPALRRRVGAAGREVVVDGYSLDRWAPRLLEVLESVTAGRQVRAEGPEPAVVAAPARPDSPG